MPHRILEYCMELMKEIKKKQNGGNGSNPLIIPIVIYTGLDKWTVTTNFSDTQKVEEKYKKYAINLKYKLIDINCYSREELTNKNTKMANMMLLEKCRNKEELRDTLIEIWSQSKSEKIKEWIEDLIIYVFPHMLGEEKETILKIIEGRNRGLMEDLLIRIEEEEKRRMKEIEQTGKMDGLKEIIKNMLKLNQDESTIMKFTNAKKKDIERAKKELSTQIK